MKENVITNPVKTYVSA